MSAPFPEDWPASEEAARLRAGLDDRVVTRPWSGAREARLVARILRATTREDLSWRGEVRLFADFVRERVAASPALKLLAASLLVHLFLGGPLLAWWAYHAVVRERAPRITFELPQEDFQPASEEDLSLEPPVPADPEEVLARRVENAVRRARFVLTRLRFRVDGDGPAPEMALARLRSAGLRDHAWPVPPRAADALPGAPPWTSPLGAVLEAERRLDQWILSGSRPPQATPALVAVSEFLAASPPPSALRTLAQRVLSRAMAYGGWPAPADFDPRSAPSPLDEEWARTLERAFAENGSGAVTVELSGAD